jgi:hypothetical protein
MAKIVGMNITQPKECLLITENEFTKSFKYSDIELFVSKGVDEETDKHFLVASIPLIEELNVAKIQFPMVFEDEAQRDSTFISFSVENATDFIEQVVSEIKNRKENLESQ